MSKKDEFISYVEKLIENDNGATEMTKDANVYWKALKSKEEKEKSKFTDNGKLILNYMKEHDDEIPRKAKDIAEDMGVSARSVSGSMRSLVNGGYVETVGEQPKLYLITDGGRNVVID